MKPIILNNILTLGHCKTLHNRYIQTIKNNQKYIKFEDESDIIYNSTALYEPYQKFKLSLVMNVDKFLSELTEKISNLYQKKLKYANSYLRMYKNGSDLRMHSDRKGLDITLSVNVGGLQNWPIYISNIKSDFHVAFWQSEIPEEFLKYEKDSAPYYTPLGTGVVCEGMYPHWREKLICSESEYVLQMFFHWSVIK